MRGARAPIVTSQTRDADEKLKERVRRKLGPEYRTGAKAYHKSSTTVELPNHWIVGIPPIAFEAHCLTLDHDAIRGLSVAWVKLYMCR